MAELAARDLLFYPDEKQQAHDRALNFGKRIIGLDRERVIERLPRYPMGFERLQHGRVVFAAVSAEFAEGDVAPPEGIDLAPGNAADLVASAFAGD